MTASQVIEQIYKSKDLDNCINKLVRKDHREDFKQEIILILLEKPEETILQLHHAAGLTYYVVRIVLNLINQKRNIYHRTYNDTTVTYDTDKVSETLKEPEPVDFEERIKEEEREILMVKEITDGLNINYETFYYRKIVEAVDKHGGVRAAAAATGIPRTTISRAMGKVKEYLNSVYNDPETIKGIY